VFLGRDACFAEKVLWPSTSWPTILKGPRPPPPNACSLTHAYPTKQDLPLVLAVLWSPLTGAASSALWLPRARPGKGLAPLPVSWVCRLLAAYRRNPEASDFASTGLPVSASPLCAGSCHERPIRRARRAWRSISLLGRPREAVFARPPAIRLPPGTRPKPERPSPSSSDDQWRSGVHAGARRTPPHAWRPLSDALPWTAFGDDLF